MTERGERGEFNEGELSGQNRLPIAEYGSGIPWIKPHNQSETDNPQKVKIPRRTRGRGRFIKNPKI